MSVLYITIFYANIGRAASTVTPGRGGEERAEGSFSARAKKNAGMYYVHYVHTKKNSDLLRPYHLIFVGSLVVYFGGQTAHFAPLCVFLFLLLLSPRGGGGGRRGGEEEVVD